LDWPAPSSGYWRQSVASFISYYRWDTASAQLWPRRTCLACKSRSLWVRGRPEFRLFIVVFAVFLYYHLAISTPWLGVMVLALVVS